MNLKALEVIDAAIAMRITGKPSSTINRYLKRLASLGVLIPEGDSKNSLYRRA